MSANIPGFDASGALMGAAAGFAAVWIMDRVDWFAYEHEDAAARERTEAVRPDGMDPAHVAADRIARRAGVTLEPRDHNPAGLAMHYAIGVVPAAFYGGFRESVPQISAGHGALFGMAMFLGHDEVMNPLLGLAAKANEYPWQAHGRGFIAHLAYGLTLETLLRLTDRRVRH
jgi:hypothetical protein